MERRKFLSLTATFTGGSLLMPQFLHAFSQQKGSLLSPKKVVFLQLNGGNDGLNTFIPYDNSLYYDFRPKIAIAKENIIHKSNGMGFHPSLKGLADIQQKGDLKIIQNVGYPNPNRSHFRSREIWQTATDSNQFTTNGWLGRFLDLQCNEHLPTAAVNFDGIDNLALKGENPNSISLKNPKKFRMSPKTRLTQKMSENPQLDFVLKVAQSVEEGADAIQKAIKNSKDEVSYPKTKLASKLKWIARLMKGDLNTKIYYTSMGGFDTHDNQLPLQKRNLTELDGALSSFYKDLSQAGLMQNTTIVVFSEFGRRVKDNGNGTDHGKAAPMFIIDGSQQGKIIGSNPNLSDLDKGDLRYQIDFRSVYASILQNNLQFDPRKIGIKNKPLANLF